MNSVHTVQGLPFNSQKLRHLRGSFSESYSASIHAYSNRTFMRAYEGSTVTSKTFKDFDNDVQLAMHSIANSPATKGSNIFVSLGTNTYVHSVYLIAALLSGFTICPMNGDDDEASIARKLSSLPGKYTVWAERLKEPTMGLTPHLMELTLSQKSSSHPKVTEFKTLPPDQPMVLIFTSGSTGYSKIVEQMEFNVLANVESIIDHHQLNQPKTIGTSLPLFHVNTLEFSFFGCLLSGSSLVLFKKFEIGTVVRSLQTDKIEILSLIPTLIRILQERSADFKPAFSSVKYVVSAAAALSKDIALQFIETYQCPILQGYGLSEAVNFSAVLPAGRPLEEYVYWTGHFAHPSVGPALPCNEIEIRNHDGACKAGEVGEVCIRGWNIMRSYSDADPAKLFADGFLHTGDLGYFQLDAAGVPFYFISGRIKDVIKRHGETLSLREVDDQVLALLPQGADAIAVGFINTVAGEEMGLIAAIETSSAQNEFCEKLKALPKFYRPSVVIFKLVALRTPSGKPQRWKFIDAFRSYRESLLGGRLVVEGENS